MMWDPARSRAVRILSMLGCWAVGCSPDASRPRDLELIGYDTLFTVGVQDGPEELTFASIRKVEAGPDGSFFVLDSQARRVSWFDRKGTFLHALTSQGQGPGEFALPVDMAFDGTSLLVLDSRNARVSVFGIAGSALLHEQDRRIPISTNRICVAGGRLFLHGPVNGMLIHELLEGDTIGPEFSPIPELPDAVGRFLSAVQVQKVVGPLLCDAEHGRIILIARSMPVVQAWSLAGDLLWHTPLAEFEPVMFEVGVQQALRPLPASEAGWRIAGSVFALDRSTIVAQYEVWLNGAQTFAAIESRAFDVTTGREIARTNVLNAIYAVSGDLAYSYNNHPFPQVVVLKQR